MTAVFIREQGAVAGRRAGRLLITRDGANVGDMPLAQVEQIVVMGNVQLTTPLMTHCLREGIDICFLTQEGTYLGRVSSPQARDGRLRLDQYRLCCDPDRSIQLSREIVEAKIYNQTVFWQRRLTAGSEVVTAMRQHRALSLDAETKDALRGIEGAAAAAHFRGLATELPSELGFTGLRTRPATDPFNALLNLGYTLLYKGMHTHLQVIGLDSYLGFLHEPRHGHAALASDLIEEFRTPIVDSLVVLLINRREITAEDFVEQPGGELRLTGSMLPQFLARYEDRLATRVRCRRTLNQFTYYQMMERQARLIARIVRGEEQEYQAYRWDY